MQKDKRTKRKEQFNHQRAMDMTDRLDRLQEFSNVQDELLTVTPKKFESLMVID